MPPAEWDSVIVATGPLTSPALSAAVRTLTDEDALAFFDAIAPIVYFESIDMDIAWFQSRYDKPGPGGTGADYINCPMDRGQYEAFIDALLDGEKTEFHEWEANTPYFEGCLPIEVMAERGRETLRHGPMKPVGLTNRHKPDEKPYAVVQLRRDNALGTLYNMVGFQTKLKYGAQTGVLQDDSGPCKCAVCPPRRYPPQHLPQFAETSRPVTQAEGNAATALCGSDHRLRGLCRVGCDRPACRPLRCRRASWRERRPAAANDGVRRPPRPYHRWPSVGKTNRGAAPSNR